MSTDVGCVMSIKNAFEDQRIYLLAGVNGAWLLRRDNGWRTSTADPKWGKVPKD
jgi:hypothetical protein